MRMPIVDTRSRVPVLFAKRTVLDSRVVYSISRGGWGGGGEKVVAIVSSRFCTKLNIAPWLHFSVTVIVLKINDVAAGGVRVINLANMILAKTDASFELVCGC